MEECGALMRDYKLKWCNWIGRAPDDLFLRQVTKPSSLRETLQSRYLRDINSWMFGTGIILDENDKPLCSNPGIDVEREIQHYRRLLEEYKSIDTKLCASINKCNEEIKAIAQRHGLTATHVYQELNKRANAGAN